MPHSTPRSMTRSPRLILALAALVLLPLAGCKPAADPAADKAAINAALASQVKAVNAKDINGIMAYYLPTPGLFVYDVITPRQYVGAEAYRKDWQGLLGLFPGALSYSVPEWTVETAGDFAYGYGTVHLSGMGQHGAPIDETIRVTDVYKKIDGKWLCVHEHASVPIDPNSGKPDMDSKL